MGGRPIALTSVPSLVACENFTGAELAALVPDALFAAFADAERDIATADLTKAAATVVPLSKTAAEKITRLRRVGQRPRTSGQFQHH